MTDSLYHFGILGMKWGRRKTPEQVSSEKDKKWEKKVVNIRDSIAVYNRAADRMNATEIKRLNSKPEYAPTRLHDSDTYKKYLKEYADTFTKVLNEESNVVFGTNPSGTKRVSVVGDELGRVMFAFEEIKHALNSKMIRFLATTDEFKRIISIAQITEEDDELKHFGVMGMRWGRRKNSSDASSSPSRPVKKKISEMTNEELKTKTERLNLEKNYREALKGGATKKAESLVTDLLVNSGKTLLSAYIAKYAAQGIKLVIAALTKKG